MIKIYKTNLFGHGQECLVIIKRGFKHYGKYVHWDNIIPQFSKQYKISGAVLGKLRLYFIEDVDLVNKFSYRKRKCDKCGNVKFYKFIPMLKLYLCKSCILNLKKEINL